MTTMRNAEIAEKLKRLADLLEIEGANTFRVRAYRDAARTVADQPHSLADMVAAGEKLEELPAIGRDIADKIAEIVRTGRLPLLEEVERRTPAGLAEILDVPGLGPKRVRTLHEALGVTGLSDLIAAVRTGRLRTLPGFGAKTEDAIRRAIERDGWEERRLKLADAEAIAEPLLAHLRRGPGVRRVAAAGSYRRRKETVGDLDLVATAARGEEVMAHFVAYDEVAEVTKRGPTRSTVRLRSGLQVDLRVVPDDAYGAALHHFTSAQAHNIRLRGLAQDQGLKINEYGVFRGEERVAGRTEEEVYATLGLPYIEPELREDRGEIEAAQAGRLPELVTQGDIRGNLHAHTTWSDGRSTLEEMAAAARAKGYGYLAITDHSRRVTVANGLDAKRLLEQLDAIDRLNDELGGKPLLLKASEVDILEDGSLDFPDDVLERLDLRVCSVHYKFNLSREEQTERIVRAMDSPYFDILAHPTGRQVNRRPPYEVDMERVMAAALERGCYLEVNAQPDRLDLSDVHCRMAKEMGLKVAISTDAHAAAGLDLMRFGVDQARRGWLGPDDVLNTRDWPELRKLLRRR